MRDALRWIGWTICAALFALITLFAYYRVRGPTPEQREAYARIAVDREPKEGRNAFPLFWYLDYDVAPEAADAKLRGEIAAVEQRLARDPKTPFHAAPDAERLAEASANGKGLCAHDGVGCVALAAADPDALSRELDAFPVLRSREAAFESSDFYWNPFPAPGVVMSTVPDTDVQRIWLSALALRHAKGERDAALAGVCENIGAWRRIRRGTNSEFMDAHAVRNVDAGLRVFADMLATTPRDVAVPPACETALEAVTAADVDRCAIIADRLAAQDALLPAKNEASRVDRALSWIMLDREQTRSWNAEIDALRCGDSATARMLRDEPVALDAVPVITERLECISSVLGCVLSGVARIVTSHDRIALDFAAHLRLARTLLWLREGDGPASARFADRPADFRSGSRETGVDEATRTVFVDELHFGQHRRFALAVALP